MTTIYAKSALLRRLQNGGVLKSKGTTSLTVLLKNKSGFMMQVFALLIAQLFVTFALMNSLSKSEQYIAYVEKHRVLFGITAFLLPLMLLLPLAFMPMSMLAKLILFTAFSTTLGISLAYTRRFVSSEIVRAALIGTIGVFVAMIIVGAILMMIGVNLWWLGGILLIALIGLLIASIVFLFMDPSKKAHRIKAIVAIVLFGAFILYDTNQILQRDYAGDFVTGALDYYLDVINVFVNFISLFVNE